MRILIENTRIINPAKNEDYIGSILIEDNMIVKTGKFEAEADRVIDGSELWAFPGFFDMHVHLREPGFEYKETIKTGADAAARGGFTGIACMPNTAPVIDNASLVSFVYDRAEDAKIPVYPIGAISKGLEGKELAELGHMAEAGAVAFTDDGNPVESGELMRNALHYASMLDIPIISHCEERTLNRNGVINEGRVSNHFGFYGIPSISEELMVTREIMLARYLGVGVHIAHVSTRGTVEIIRRAKAEGIKVTAEVTPHHLVLTEDEFFTRQFDPNLKMNPPLRTEDDRKALLEGLRDGTIDVIATDHAPHAIHEKDDDFPGVPFGVIGLETAVGVLLDRLVNQGELSPARMAEVMSINPRMILGIHGGMIETNTPADITLVGMKKWKVEPEKFASLSRNTPFAGWELAGKPIFTIAGGEIVFEDTK